MRLSVIVPWRDKGDDRRRANLVVTLAHLRIGGFDPHVVGDGRDDGPFNRSAAYNLGREQFPADVYVWHEADMMVPPVQLRQAVNMAVESPGLVVPFTDYHATSPETGAEIHAGADPASLDCNVVGDGVSVGAVGVASEATMRLVGGWDECFAGWGFDDNAMRHAFHVCAGAMRWVDGPAWHLWHRAGASAVSEVEASATAGNAGRLSVYMSTSDPEAIRVLTGEGRRDA